ncbi:MAG: ribosome assembly RNA-binding protein YhbY [Lachnospiraceae bacterium]|nr:ribosome assembly RNA-binding protein YhbY [Lachnospiraceae bacterium]
MTSKQRAYLKGLAMKMDPVFHIGKESLTPEIIKGLDEAVTARELIKVAVLKNCEDDVRSIAETASERTNTVLVQVIGRRFVLYRPAKKPKIQLPDQRI